MKARNKIRLIIGEIRKNLAKTALFETLSRKVSTLTLAGQTFFVVNL